MRIGADKIEGVLRITPEKRFSDHRGEFAEMWRNSNAGDMGPFVQENRVVSITPGVFRGMHMDTRQGSGKLVWCESGEFISYGLDTRQDSKTYGKVAMMALQPGDGYFWLPEGIAHGLLCIIPGACRYRLTLEYDASYEKALSYQCIQNELPRDLTLVLSDKDKAAPLLGE